MEQGEKSRGGTRLKMSKSYQKVNKIFFIQICFFKNYGNVALQIDRATHKKLETDPMFKLNHDFVDKTKKLDAAPEFHDIVDKRSEWRDDYSLNKMARQAFRVI